MLVNKNTISFSFSDEDLKLFNKNQKEDWKNIEKYYTNLSKRLIKKVELLNKGTEKEWIASRVNLHRAPSLMRLLYLTETFCESTLNFNSVSCAMTIKAMIEIPLHLGYIVWILDQHKDFKSVKEELMKISFGNRDSQTGLTKSAKITQKNLYIQSDKMIKKFFKENSQTSNTFEELYKEANATGHHNFEARMLCGLENKGIWKERDRREQFIFFDTKIFSFSLNCVVILFMTNVFMKAIDHYLDQMPDTLPSSK